MIPTFIAAFGGVIFAILFLLGGIIASESENTFWSVVFFAAVGIFLYYTGQYIFLLPFVTNPILIIPFAILYIGIGAAFTGLYLWPDYIKSFSIQIKQRFDSWLKDEYGNVKGGLDNDEDKYEKFLSSTYYESKWHPTKNKNRLINWIFMWPFSALWVLSHKPIIWIYEKVYNNLGDWFVKIGKAVAKNILKSSTK